MDTKESIIEEAPESPIIMIDFREIKGVRYCNITTIDTEGNATTSFGTDAESLTFLKSTVEAL